MEYINKVFICKSCGDKIGYSSVTEYKEELCSKCSGVNVYK